MNKLSQQSSKYFTEQKLDLIYLLLLALGSFALYATTAVPGPFDGDYGEFQYMPRLLGLPHPTGYPSYLLLGWLWSWLPIGTMAFRLNIFSVFWASLTLIFIFIIAREQKFSRMAALAGTLALAVVPAFWRYTGLAAVYTLHTALLAIALYLWLHWERHHTSKGLWLAAFLTGLSLTNHPTAAFLVPAVGLFVLSELAAPPLLKWFKKKEGSNQERFSVRKGEPADTTSVRDWLIGAVCFALPGLLYLYVPLRLWMIGPGQENFGLKESIAKGQITPFLDWSLYSVLNYITGRSLLLEGNYPDWFLLWTDLPSLLLQEFNLPIVILGAMGMLLWVWRKPRSWLLLAILFMPTAAYAITYDISFAKRDQIAHLEGHLLPALLVFSLWIAQGVNGVIMGVSRVVKWRADGLVGWCNSGMVKLLGEGLGSLLLLLLFGVYLQGSTLPTEADRIQSDSIRAYWSEVLAYPLEEEAALTGHWGDLTAFWYFQHGEGVRPDLWAIFPPNIPQIEAWISKSSRPLYLAGPLLNWSPELSKRYNLTPWGILVRIAPLDDPPLFPAIRARSATFGEQLELKGYYTTSLAARRAQLWLAWQTLTATSRDLSVSVRLHAPDDTMLLQKDGRLASLWFPDGTMPAQQALLSAFDLTLPEHLPADTTVRIVVYDPQTIEPLLTSEGEDVIELGIFKRQD